MDARSNKSFVFLSYNEIKNRFYHLVDAELKQYSVNYVDQLPPHRSSLLLEIYSFIDYLDKEIDAIAQSKSIPTALLDIREPIYIENSQLMTAALLDIKKRINGEYYVVSAEGGLFNKGSLVYQRIDRAIGITNNNQMDNKTGSLIKAKLTLSREKKLTQEESNKQNTRFETSSSSSAAFFKQSASSQCSSFIDAKKIAGAKVAPLIVKRYLRKMNQEELAKEIRAHFPPHLSPDMYKPSTVASARK